MLLADALEVLIKVLEKQKLTKVQKRALETVKELAKLVPAEGLIS